MVLTQGEETKKERNLKNTHDGDMENTHKNRFVVMGGELVGKLMYMSNTYECLDRVRKYGRRESWERGREYARTAAFRGVIGTYMQQGRERRERGRCLGIESLQALAWYH